jgi:macrodomain Ter protein organizer (MatP/YcbG family)
MMNIAIPDSLYYRLQVLASRHNTNIEVLVEEAINHEAMRRETSAFFTERKKHFNSQAFQTALSAIPDDVPDANDQI